MGEVFTSIPAGHLVGTDGADPCVGAIIIQRTGGVVTKISVYHFEADDHPPNTLARDGALAPGAEVILFGGSNGNESRNGLYKSIIDAIPGSGATMRGISGKCGLWVDKDGNLFIHAAEQAFPESEPF